MPPVETGIRTTSDDTFVCFQLNLDSDEIRFSRAESYEWHDFIAEAVRDSYRKAIDTARQTQTAEQPEIVSPSFVTVAAARNSSVKPKSSELKNDVYTRLALWVCSGRPGGATFQTSDKSYVLSVVGWKELPHSEIGVLAGRPGFFSRQIRDIRDWVRDQTEKTEDESRRPPSIEWAREQLEVEGEIPRSTLNRVINAYESEVHRLQAIKSRPPLQQPEIDTDENREFQLLKKIRIGVVDRIDPPALRFRLLADFAQTSPEFLSRHDQQINFLLRHLTGIAFESEFRIRAVIADLNRLSDFGRFRTAIQTASDGMAKGTEVALSYELASDEWPIGRIVTRSANEPHLASKHITMPPLFVSPLPQISVDFEKSTFLECLEAFTEARASTVVNSLPELNRVLRNWARHPFATGHETMCVADALQKIADRGGLLYELCEDVGEFKTGMLVSISMTTPSDRRPVGQISVVDVFDGSRIRRRDKMFSLAAVRSPPGMR